MRRFFAPPAGFTVELGITSHQGDYIEPSHVRPTTGCHNNHHHRRHETSIFNRTRRTKFGAAARQIALGKKFGSAGLGHMLLQAADRSAFKEEFDRNSSLSRAELRSLHVFRRQHLHAQRLATRPLPAAQCTQRTGTRRARSHTRPPPHRA